jgi:hypothetical protein
MNESSFVIPIFRRMPRRLESPLLLARRSIASERDLSASGAHIKATS